MNTNHLSNLCHNIKTSDKNNNLTVKVMFSKKSLDILSILLKEGFIRGYFVDKNMIVILLKFINDKKMFGSIKQSSKFKYNIYSSNSELRKDFNGFNISILSTKKGVMSNKEAINSKLGGFHLIDIT